MRREGFDQHNGERLSIVVPNSASGASSLADSAIGRITKPQGSFGATNNKQSNRQTGRREPQCCKRHEPDTPRFCPVRDRRTGQDSCRHQRHHDQVAALTWIFFTIYVALSRPRIELPRKSCLATPRMFAHCLTCNVLRTRPLSIMTFIHSAPNKLLRSAPKIYMQSIFSAEKGLCE